MILRKYTSPFGSGVYSAWQAFADVEQSDDLAEGFVSQPAHASLAGMVAAALAPDVFGHLPDDAVEAVGFHDVGWSAPDLAALERAHAAAPIGFLAFPPEEAVLAWRRSIVEAERRSPLQGVLTSRHFCLLAPRDHHAAHEAFCTEENLRRTLMETDFRAEDLKRWTAALGFCDLISLCMCSGVQGRFEVPVAHPADSQAGEAPKTIFSISDGEVGFAAGTLREPREIFVDGWERTASRSLSSRRWKWRLAQAASE